MIVHSHAATAKKVGRQGISGLDEGSAKRATGGRRSAETRRANIISAARTLFARQGFHSTGMAQIARESEVLVGQIYRDFASKEHLIAALVEANIVQWLDDPAIACAAHPGQAEALNRWVRRFITKEMDSETRSVLADIVSEATRNERIGAILDCAYHRLRKGITTAASLWLPCSQAAASREKLADFIMAIAGASQQRQFFGQPPDPDIDAKLVGLVEAEIAMIQARYAGQPEYPGGDT